MTQQYILRQAAANLAGRLAGPGLDSWAISEAQVFDTARVCGRSLNAFYCGWLHSFGPRVLHINYSND